MSRIYSSYIWDLSWTLVSNTSVFPTWSAGGRPRDSVTHTCRPTFPLTDACEGLPLSLCLLFISQWPSPLHGGTQTSERLLTITHTHTFHVPNTVYTFTSHTHTLAYRWFHSWLTVCCSGLSVNVREMTVEICPGGEKKVNLGEGAFPTCSAFFFFSPVTTFENTGEYTPEILRRWSHNFDTKTVLLLTELWKVMGELRMFSQPSFSCSDRRKDTKSRICSRLLFSLTLISPMFWWARVYGRYMSQGLIE